MTERPDQEPEHIVIDVWVWPLVADPIELCRLHALLNDDETSRASRFVSRHDRDEFVVAHGRMRQLLGCLMNRDPQNLQFGYNANGKPFIAGGFHFNLTHSGSRAALAICATHEVGIDIETPRQIDLTIAERFFSPSEYAAILAETDPQSAFFRCWSRKEAVLKALGSGLSLETRSFSVPVARSQTRGELLPVSGLVGSQDINWALLDFDPGENFVGAIALHSCGSRPDVVLHKADGDVHQ